MLIHTRLSGAGERLRPDGGDSGLPIFAVADVSV